MGSAAQVLAKLDQIESEMRRVGFWDDALAEEQIRAQAVSYAEARGMSPVGSMSFEHWLQAVFIPNARNAAHSDTLPTSSQVSVMAMREYDYHSHVPEAEPLLTLLSEFDELFTASKRPERPPCARLKIDTSRPTSKPWWKFR